MLVALAVPKKFIKCQPDVFRDLAQQDGRDIAPLVKGYGRAFTRQIPELLMRTSLANFRETERNENCDNLA